MPLPPPALGWTGFAFSGHISNGPGTSYNLLLYGQSQEALVP